MPFGILYGMRLSGVYKILNLENGNFYVGSSVQVESRIFKHLSFLRRGDHPNKHLQAAFSKYKEPSFDFELLEKCEKAELIAREQHYIDSLKPEYNICKVAGNTLGVLHGPEAKAKMTVANKGNKRRLGKEHSEITKQLIGNLASKRTHTEAAKAKISKSLVGNSRTAGHKLSDVHKALVGQAALNMWNGEGKQTRRLAASERAKARWADPAWREENAIKIAEGKKEAKRARLKLQIDT